jgi:hypothetical protein
MSEELTREDVERAMRFLSMVDPKASQNIPLHETIVGHLIVAVARMFEGVLANLEEC